MERLNIYYWIAGRGIAEVGFVVDNGSRWRSRLRSVSKLRV